MPTPSVTLRAITLVRWVAQRAVGSGMRKAPSDLLLEQMGFVLKMEKFHGYHQNHPKSNGLSWLITSYNYNYNSLSSCFPLEIWKDMKSVAQIPIFCVHFGTRWVEQILEQREAEWPLMEPTTTTVTANASPWMPWMPWRLWWLDTIGILSKNSWLLSNIINKSIG